VKMNLSGADPSEATFANFKEYAELASFAEHAHAVNGVSEKSSLTYMPLACGILLYVDDTPPRLP
jgi:hypothetical protein